MLDLKHRWALVTGASRGVGKSVAEGLASYGCNLILHSRKKEHTLSDAEEYRQKYGVEVVCVEAYLEDKRQVEKMLKEVENLKKDIGIVYNVAAVNSNVLDFFSAGLEEYETIFSVNVFAVAQICNYFIPKMLQKGFGRVINVVSSVNNEPKAMVYGASKAALIKLTKEMAYAVHGTDVMINMADPGWVRTDMGTDNAPTAVEECRTGMLLGTVMEDHISGRYFCAGDYYGMDLEAAYRKEIEQPSARIPDFLKGSLCLPKVSSLKEFREKYAEFITSSLKKVVFGGGNQAKFFLDVFEYTGCKVDAVLCTKRAEGIHDFHGIPLYGREKFPFTAEECVIIIAITEQHVRQVEQTLQAQGYRILPSYSILYTVDNWRKENGQPVSNVFEYKTNTFKGNGIGQL